MKKILLVFVAFVLVASGVAAVSAYEAHIINVKAKVENALTVSPDEDWELGTIFPQEFFIKHYTVSLSQSFLDQKWADPGTKLIPGRVNAVEIAFWAEEKLKTPGNPLAIPPTLPTYYAWMGEFIKLGTAIVDDHINVLVKGGTPAAGSDGNINFADDGWQLVGPAPGGPSPQVKAVLTGRILGLQPIPAVGLQLQIDSFALSIGVDAPVFAGYYNYETDVVPKQNGLDVPTWIVPASDTVRHNGGLGTEFGLDIKVQVTDIYQQPVL